MSEKNLPLVNALCTIKGWLLNKTCTQCDIYLAWIQTAVKIQICILKISKIVIAIKTRLNCFSHLLSTFSKYFSAFIISAAFSVISRFIEWLKLF